MNDTAQVFGLPLHPLLVHAVVVLLPLGVLALVFAQFWPSARRAIGLASPVAALIVATLVPVTIAAGESLAAMTGSLPSVIEHERYGRMLLPWSTALFVTAVAQWAWFRWVKPRLQQALRKRWVTTISVVLGAAVIIVALGSVTVLILTGHSGSRSVWGSILP